MNKEELLKKLKALSEDERGNENERKRAEERLNKLLIKYNIDPESINTEKLVRRDLYYKDEMESKLLHQVIYKICGDRQIYRQMRKRNWIWCDMTDAEFIQFEMEYPAYKAAWHKELDIFYLAFVQKNRIFPPETLVPPKENADEAVPSKYSRADRIRAAMMAEGIEFTKIRRQLNEQN